MRAGALEKIRTPQLDSAQIRSRARILLIDDDKFSYDQLFRVRDGYRLEKWSQLKNLVELQDGTYDLIILDYYGVAPKSAPTDEGLAILRSIKKARPEQLVLAYSGQALGLQSSEFISLADDVVSKSEDYPVFQSKVDQLLRKRYSVGHYVALMNQALDEDALRVPKFVPRVITAISRGDTTKLRRYLERNDITVEQIDRVLSLTKNAISIVALLA